MIKVLVVDDSNFMRNLVSSVLSSDGSLEVVGTALNGVDAIEKVKQLAPDVVTMDINMPRMDGIEAVGKIMEENPVPVIMVSAKSKKGARQTLEALKQGAVDFIQKPHGEVSPNLEAIRSELIKKVKKAARCPVNKTKPVSGLKAKPLPWENRDHTGSEDFFVLVIGSSTGGPSVVESILGLLPPGIPLAVIVVQHMPETFTKIFARQLNESSSLRVEEASPYRVVEKGVVLVAPGGQNIYLSRRGRVLLKKAAPGDECMEDANVTMKEVARVFGGRSIGVILSGMGKDGADGIRAIKNTGGITMAQNEDSCVVFGMPGEAIKTGKVDLVLTPHEIAKQVAVVVRTGVPASGRKGEKR